MIWIAKLAITWKGMRRRLVIAKLKERSNTKGTEGCWVEGQRRKKVKEEEEKEGEEQV